MRSKTFQSYKLLEEGLSTSHLFSAAHIHPKVSTLITAGLYEPPGPKTPNVENIQSSPHKVCYLLKPLRFMAHRGT